MKRCMLWLCLLVLIKVVCGDGWVEIHFLRYTDNCRDNLGTEDCDPYFTFCLSKERPPDTRPKLSPCEYGRKGTSHFHTTDDIDFSDSSNIKGVPNPWRFKRQALESRLSLTAEVHDQEPWFMEDEHLHTWHTRFQLMTGQSKLTAQWKTINMKSSDHMLKFKARQYCNENYYTQTCDVYCLARNDVTGHYTCDVTTGTKICLPGWEGVDCDLDIDECQPMPCSHGNCTNYEGGYSCSCPQHFSGLNCEIMDDVCSPNPCANGGQCYGRSDVFDYQCFCQSGWEGKNCDTRLNHCLTTPCLNGGTCVSDFSTAGFTCTCLANFTGDLCQNVTQRNTTTSTTPTTPTTPTTSTTPTTPAPNTPPAPISSFTKSSPPMNQSKTTNISIAATVAVFGTASVSDDESAQAGFSKVEDNDDDGFDQWYILLLCIVVIIALMGILLIFLKRKRKLTKEPLYFDNPVVFSTNERLAFDNRMYADNMNNMERERRAMSIPQTRPPPTPTTCTPAALGRGEGCGDGEIGETGGAVGGHMARDDVTMCKLKCDDNNAKSKENPYKVIDNPYSDFESLRNYSPCLTGLDESEYQDLDELAMDLRSETSDEPSHYANSPSKSSIKDEGFDSSAVYATPKSSSHIRKSQQSEDFGYDIPAPGLHESGGLEDGELKGVSQDNRGYDVPSPINKGQLPLCDTLPAHANDQASGPDGNTDTGLPVSLGWEVNLTESPTMLNRSSVSYNDNDSGLESYVDARFGEETNKQVPNIDCSNGINIYLDNQTFHSEA